MHHIHKSLLDHGYSESKVRVRYAETDQMGVVYHANYLIWFEVGRVDFIRSLGLSYAEMEREEDTLIAVAEVSARYKQPARYDDELLIRTSLVSFHTSIIKFHYQVIRVADEAVLCEGATTHLVIGRDMKRRTMPAKYAERFALIPHRIHTGRAVRT